VTRTLPSAPVTVARGSFDPRRVREEFPILKQTIRGKPLVYLDSAATAQKPKPVLDALLRFYETEYSNIHRGVHELAERATRAYESVRGTVRRFLHAAEDREIVFVRGSTEGINLVARSFGGTHVGRGDEVLVTEMEHHSNLVPWQILCEEKGARLRAVPVRDDGTLDLDALEGMLGPRTRILAVAHVSNVLGTINPIARIVEIAHRSGVPVLVDGAQAAPRLPVDVRALDCDFYVFSGHKAYGPSGAGVLYGKAERLSAMPPYQGGGEMISRVSFEGTTVK